MRLRRSQVVERRALSVEEILNGPKKARIPGLVRMIADLTEQQQRSDAELAMLRASVTVLKAVMPPEVMSTTLAKVEAAMAVTDGGRWPSQE